MPSFTAMAPGVLESVLLPFLDLSFRSASLSSDLRDLPESLEACSDVVRDEGRLGELPDDDSLVEVEGISADTE